MMVVFCAIYSWILLIQMETSPLLTANSSHQFSNVPKLRQLDTEEHPVVWEENPGDLQFMRKLDEDPDGLRSANRLDVEREGSSTEIDTVKESQIQSVNDDISLRVRNTSRSNQKNATFVKVGANRQRQIGKREADAENINNSDTSTGKSRPRAGEKHKTL